MGNYCSTSHSIDINNSRTTQEIYLKSLFNSLDPNHKNYNRNKAIYTLFYKLISLEPSLNIKKTQILFNDFLMELTTFNIINIIKFYNIPKSYQYWESILEMDIMREVIEKWTENIIKISDISKIKILEITYDFLLSKYGLTSNGIKRFNDIWRIINENN